MAKFLNRAVAFDYPLPIVRPESVVVGWPEQSHRDFELRSPHPDDPERMVCIAFGDEESMVRMLREGGKVEAVAHTQGFIQYKITEPFQ